MPANDVDENRLDVSVREHESERRRDALGRGAAADVEEVGRRAARIFDHVHRRHREAGAVDDAADVAVEADIVEVVLGGLDLARVFLRMIAHVGDVAAAEQGVVVERHLGVERQHAVVLRHHQRIDFDHRRVEIAERAIGAEHASPRRG